MLHKSTQQKLAYNKAYYWAHREEIKERGKGKLAAKNAYNKEYKLLNSEKVRRRMQEYIRSPRGRYKNFLSRLSLTDREIVISFEEFLQILDKPCFYCKGSLGETGCGIDRVDNDIRYISSNCRPCCPQCNIAKCDYTEQEFREWVERVYNNWVGVKS
jgi:hypothetical protein